MDSRAFIVGFAVGVITVALVARRIAPRLASNAARDAIRSTLGRTVIPPEILRGITIPVEQNVYDRVARELSPWKHST